MNGVLPIIAAFVIVLVANVLENWYREKADYYSRTEYEQRAAGRLWHIWQTLGIAGAFGIIVFAYVPELLDGMRVLLLLAAVWWIAFDGGLNMLRSRPFFMVSKMSTSPVEMLGTWWVKLLLLAAAALLICKRYFESCE